ncbi:MAG: DnaA/Hda family protein, partial [Kangiellaceae bacterium]|nr:DnaA/Hda family protein [Kangiellaceae bacterium]
MQQLPLNVLLDDSVELSNFIPGKNSVLVDYLTQLDSKNEFIFIWGEPGSGKSHLLQAVANHLNGKNIFYLAADQDGLAPEMLQSLETFDWLLIDDLQRLLNGSQWQESLFHLYNKINDNGGNLIITANSPPLDLNIELQDLTSRLSAMTV